MQDCCRGQPGRATTLFTNTFPIGAMLAGPLFGLAQHFGFRLAYAHGTGLCLPGRAADRCPVTLTPLRLPLSRARTG